MDDQKPRERLLRPKEAAELLGISTLKLGEYRRAGKIPAYRLSRKTIRYDAHEILKFLREQEAPCE